MLEWYQNRTLVFGKITKDFNNIKKPAKYSAPKKLDTIWGHFMYRKVKFSIEFKKECMT
ncbi:hypothetical protein GGR97_002834, partial [Wenyingzhuangia aestuarii]|nr:hypothetical protein [Wenyingzhuangia aestuarii]